MKNLTKKYTFYDTFVKTCEFKNGKGDCSKTRESKKCIDNNCEIVKIPMEKKEILNNYYQNYSNDTQVGSGHDVSSKQDDTFICPYCKKILPVENLIKHVKKHTNIDLDKPTNKSFDELFPQFGGCDSCNMIGSSNHMIGGNGCDSCMIGGAIYKKKYKCPLCKDYFYISHMKEHFINYHK